MNRSRLPGITGSLRYALALLPLLAPALGYAQDETPTLNSGDTAWMLTATVLVLFMTIPGLALFYGGMVRSKNVLSVLMQCFAITALVSVLWVIYGYSLVFEQLSYWGATVAANISDTVPVAGPLMKQVLLGGDKVLMSSDCPRSAVLLRYAGLEPVLVDISEFSQLEGCVTCLSVRLREAPHAPQH